ncbi:acyltransferase family protein [Leptolyngbya sp. KIOST-1]|uniref:acyltransferase family protein n=1 Tax=Leptolyngbya sp. KIOST-1 TaxID=1229172 RepID=UPI0009DCE2CB|nr:acyltransferase family protein [Leptolyngbya sp. KIOST-1]
MTFNSPKNNPSEANHLEHQFLQSSYRPEIDGLRAIAIVAVIINHFNKEFLPSGFLGVDIFFVISGFVTTNSLITKSKSENSQDFLLIFYSKRIKRLIPSLIAFSLIAGVLACMFDESPATSLWTGISALFGVANLTLFNQSTDYFSAPAELNIFTHTWSLGVETQFYLLFPLLVYMSGVKYQRIEAQKILVSVVGFLSSLSLISFLYFYPINRSASYFLITTRFWEIGLGVLLFFLASKKDFSSHRAAKKLTLISILMIVFAFCLPITLAAFSTVLVAGLTTVLIICLNQKSGLCRILSNSKIAYIGVISYSLYLWHWGILCISRLTIGIHWWSIPIQIGLTVIAATASFRYIESPLRVSKWPKGHHRSIAYWLMSSSIISVFFFLLIKNPAFSIYMGNNPSVSAGGVLSLMDPYHLSASETSWQGEACILSENSQARAKKMILIEECTLGSFSEGKKRVAVFGNSFSAAFTQGFDDLVASDKYAVTITSSWDASPVKEVPNVGGYAEASNYYWDTIVPSIVEDLRPGDWVFLINDLAWLSPKDRTAESEIALDQFSTGLNSFSDSLAARGLKLAVLHGNPFAREAYCKPSAAVKQWFQPFKDSCKLPNRRESLARRIELDKTLKVLEQEGKIRVVDLFDVFCPGDRCTYSASNGELLYRDEYSHPSVEAARLSAPIIRQILTSS